MICIVIDILISILFSYNEKSFFVLLKIIMRQSHAFIVNTYIYYLKFQHF